MNIAPTCPKCLRPYWDDGSQTAVSICKCVEHTLPPPSLIVTNEPQILNLLNEINKKLDKSVSIPLGAEVSVNFEEETYKIIIAGNKLAEAAHKVQSDYDGIHRLRLALAEWYRTRANEFNRDNKISD